MANKIICIAREFGSGGHEIAVKTGSKLGIRVYEKDLFRLACKYTISGTKTAAITISIFICSSSILSAHCSLFF